MANYKNSLGESELFGRMTAGFSKVMESVQSGRFQRDGYGTIVESCNEDENGAPAEGADAGAPADGGDQGVAPAEGDAQGSTDDADAVANATPEQVNGSVTETAGTDYFADDDEVFIGRTVDGSACDSLGWTWDDTPGSNDFAKDGPVYMLTADGKKDYGEWINAEQVGGNLNDGRLVDSPKKHLSREEEWEFLTDPENGLSEKVEARSETVARKPMKTLVPEGCCGGKRRKVLKEGALGSAIGGAAGAVIGGAVGHPVVGAGIGAACGHSLTEGAVRLCKTCGNPLDETGTCQDCQGYSQVKENDDEIKLQVPANIRRQAALKANAKANQEKLAKAIRGGKADGIVKEDDEGDSKPVFGTFTIKIETGNAAFGGDNAEDVAAEIIRIIEKKMDDILPVVQDGGCVKLLDTNGNSVGTMCFETSED